MRTLSLKFPVHLEALVAREAKQQRVSKASVVRSCVEEVLLKRPQAEQQLTCADLAGDLIGSLDGPADLSTNKRYLEEAMEEDFQRGRNDHRRHRFVVPISHTLPRHSGQGRRPRPGIQEGKTGFLPARE